MKYRPFWFLVVIVLRTANRPKAAGVNFLSAKFKEQSAK